MIDLTNEWSETLSDLSGCYQLQVRLTIPEHSHVSKLFQQNEEQRSTM